MSLGVRMFTPRTGEQQGHSAQRTFLPSADLAEYVRSIEYRETREADDALHPIAFTVFPFVSFYLGTPCTVYEYGCGQRRLLPRISVVGPCDHRVADLNYGANFRALRVVFEPTGFFRLFRISPAELRNLARDGVEVLGPRVGELQARLQETRCPEQMARLAEQMLRTWRANVLPRSGIELAAQRLLHCRGRTDLGAIANSLGLSDSSWRRHFSTEIGVTPKRYFRMLRFEHAIGLKLKFPEWSWTQVCLESGYYDQAHFIADCQAIAHCTPSGFMREIAAMPAPVADALYGHAVRSHDRVRAASRSEGASATDLPPGRFLPVRAA
jgi:AraC-like DNA-binding protein